MTRLAPALALAPLRSELSPLKWMATTTRAVGIAIALRLFLA
jgi:hypothetical protein